MGKSNIAAGYPPVTNARKADPVVVITSLTASRDATTIQQAISDKYGFTPTIAYCMALIDFVEALTDGQ